VTRHQENFFSAAMTRDLQQTVDLMERALEENKDSFLKGLKDTVEVSFYFQLFRHCFQ